MKTTLLVIIVVALVIFIVYVRYRAQLPNELMVKMHWYAVTWLGDQLWKGKKIMNGYVTIYCTLYTPDEITIIGSATKILFRPDTSQEWIALELTSDRPIWMTIDKIETIERRTMPKPSANNFSSRKIRLNARESIKGYFTFPVSTFQKFLDEFRSGNCY